ncbi:MULTISPECIES: AMP-binding protein [Bacillaceae]|uniref:AMP-binding protein n=1 Tax=Bacillaceae TaxID=186817 RepID=UPI002041F312|nr:AMP-binding protein [Caldibacillus thermoamylovorans]MCM3055081.1 AMP-binding protein [Caldibacillus thermoamylovorans]
MNTEMNVELSKRIDRVRRNTLGDLLKRTRERVPNKIAIAYNEMRLTYSELDDLVNQTAHAFIADGMKKGDMIAVISKNSLDFVIVNFALARIGAVMIPLNYMLTSQDVKYVINHAGVCGFLSAVEFAPVLDTAAGSRAIRFRYLMDYPIDKSVPDELKSWKSLAFLILFFEEV